MCIRDSKSCCCAAYGIERAGCYPPGPPVKSRAILTYPYSKPGITLAFGVLSGDFGNDQFPRLWPLLATVAITNCNHLPRPCCIAAFANYMRGQQVIALVQKRLRRLRSKRHPTSVQGVMFGSLPQETP